jgi:RNA polymerase sigma factor (sigma-70 family)
MTPRPTPDFASLMARARSGCPDAAREVFQRFSPHIARVVRRQLHQRLRAVYDSDDFLQAVWASFFAVRPEEYTFSSPETLLAFLSQVAYNKVVEVFRNRVQTAKRAVAREVPLDDLSREQPVRQPTPSQEAIAKERWQQMLDGQSPLGRRALEMLRQGHTHEEVGRVLGLHPKAIQRLLRGLDEERNRP